MVNSNKPVVFKSICQYLVPEPLLQAFAVAALVVAPVTSPIEPPLVLRDCAALLLFELLGVTIVPFVGNVHAANEAGVPKKLGEVPTSKR